MGLFIFRFWPVLIPLLVYWLWHWHVCRKAVKAGQPKPRFRDGPIFWMVLSSLVIAMGCFVVLGLNIDGEKGEYTPAHLEGGVLVPGRVNP